MSVFMSRQVELPAAALPGGGLATGQAYTALPFGVSEVTYWVVYTAVTATGRPGFVLQCSNDVEEPVQQLLDGSSLASSLSAVTGASFQVDIANEVIRGPAPGAAATWAGWLTFKVPVGCKCRLLALEVGDTANPGVALAAVTGWGSG